MDALLASFLIQSALGGVFLVALWGIAFAYRRPLHRALAIGWTIYLLHLVASLVAAWYGRQSPLSTTRWSTATLQLVSVAGSCLYWYGAIRLLANRQERVHPPRRAFAVALAIVAILLLASVISGQVLHQPGSGPLGLLYPVPYAALVIVAWSASRHETVHRRQLIWLGVAFLLFVARLVAVQTVLMPEETFATAGLPRLLAVATVQLVQSVAVGVISISVAVAYERIAVLQQTERLMQAEARLRKGQQLEMLGRMAAGIAHDFNNVLTAIGASVTMAEDSLAAPDEARAELRRAEEEVDRATRLTKRLLAFAQPQLGRSLAAAAVDDVVRGSEPMLSRLVGSHIALDTRVATHGALVSIDQVQLEQILLNLVVNARDAIADRGRITIEATVETFMEPLAVNEGTLPNGRYVLLSVQDTGSGIPADVLPRILEPFFTTKAERGGTGIGLATIHQIVVAAHGDVAISSTVGKGTRVNVYLPVLPPEDGASALIRHPSA